MAMFCNKMFCSNRAPRFVSSRRLHQWLNSSIFAFALLCAIFSLSAFSADDPFAAKEETEFLKVDEAYQVAPIIEDDALNLVWSIEDGYYLYQHQFKVEARSNEGSEFINLSFQDGKKKYDEFFDKELVVYYEETEVSGPAPTIAGPYELKITSQGCADAGLCYPPRHQYFVLSEDGVFEETLASTFSGGGASNNTLPSSENSSLTGPAPDEDTPFLPFVVLSALLGGLILNLMPCVFPVLSLKALSFASSHLNPTKQHLHGWAYTAGVVGSFWIAAIIILVAKGTGESLGWGFQLQKPGFVAFMAYLFFIMGLSLSGVFHIGTRLMGTGQSLTQGEGLSSSFFTGVLAALVASPCTAPLMAPALGYALTQPAYVALLIFTALGFGMALPFILLSYMPKLASYLPAPGAWMDTLKQVLAFPLYLTSVWLLWVYGNQTSSSGAMAVLAGGVLIAFGFWLKEQRPSRMKLRWFTRSLAVASVLTAAYVAWLAGGMREGDSDMWEPYSPQTLAELRSTNTPVFIDLTADWCITCKFNERVALNTQEVARFAAINDIAMLQGDWTNADPIITELLEQFGRSGVPLYIMYPASSSKPPVVLPQILTKEIVLKAMEEAL